MVVNGKLIVENMEWKKIKPGYYKVEEVIRKIQKDIDKVGAPLEISYDRKRKRVKIICVKNMVRCIVTNVGQGKSKETCVSFSDKYIEMNGDNYVCLLHMDDI